MRRNSVKTRILMFFLIYGVIMGCVSIIIWPADPVFIFLLNGPGLWLGDTVYTTAINYLSHSGLTIPWVFRIPQIYFMTSVLFWGLVGGFICLVNPEKIFRFIDLYPDFATFTIILIFSILQLIIGNNIKAIILSVSLMLPNLIVILPTNVVIKRIFKSKRPEQYYKSVKGRTIFEGSFPSFHSHFSAGEATTYIVGIALYSSNLRLTATLLAIITVGLASIIIAYSRVALKMHHPVDVLGGFILGVATGFVVSYTMGRLIWDQIPLAYHVVMIFVFVTFVFLLSRKQRKMKV